MGLKAPQRGWRRHQEGGRKEARPASPAAGFAGDGARFAFSPGERVGGRGKGTPIFPQSCHSPSFWCRELRSRALRGWIEPCSPLILREREPPLSRWASPPPPRRFRHRLSSRRRRTILLFPHQDGRPGAGAPENWRVRGKLIGVVAPRGGAAIPERNRTERQSRQVGNRRAPRRVFDPAARQVLVVPARTGMIGVRAAATPPASSGRRRSHSSGCGSWRRFTIGYFGIQRDRLQTRLTKSACSPAPVASQFLAGSGRPVVARAASPGAVPWAPPVGRRSKVEGQRTEQRTKNQEQKTKKSRARQSLAPPRQGQTGTKVICVLPRPAVWSQANPRAGEEFHLRADRANLACVAWVTPSDPPSESPRWPAAAPEDWPRPLLDDPPVHDAVHVDGSDLDPLAGWCQPQPGPAKVRAMRGYGGDQPTTVPRDLREQPERAFAVPRRKLHQVMIFRGAAPSCNQSKI
jgi:hypothetical protein